MEAETFIENHHLALAELINGSKCRQSVFVHDRNSLEAKKGNSIAAPSLLAVRALTSLAAAEARRLYLRGEKRAALDLLLAAYRFGSDISADPNGGLTRRINRSGLPPHYLYRSDALDEEARS